MKEYKIFNIFKIEYDWYEGEHEDILLGKYTESNEFEKDLVKAKKFAESLIGKEVKSSNYLGKGYANECLPEYYEQIIWYLMNKLGYTHCSFDEDIAYDVDDGLHCRKISIIKFQKHIKRTELKEASKG